MRKRINNDFDALVEVLHEGVKIDLSLYEITSVRMVSNQAYSVTDYEIRNGSLFLHVTPLIVPKIGRYKIVVTYRIADPALADGFWNYEFDKYLVTIVGSSEEEDAGDVVITADAVIGMQGKSAYQVWLDAGNTGTVEDYLEDIKGDPFRYDDFTPEQLEALKVKGDPFLYEDFTPEQIAELQKPATDAVTAVNEAEALRVTAETTRVENEQGRVTAEGTRQSNETAREDGEDERDAAEYLRLSAEITRGQNEQERVTAEGLRVTAEGLRQTNTATAITNANNAATNANTKAGLANTAATNANAKATLADTAATNANEKAGLADTAATNANNARLAIASDLALKVDKSSVKQVTGTSTTDVMSQKAVTDELANNPIATYLFNSNPEIVVSSIDYDTNIITSPNHGLADGDTVVATLNTNTNLFARNVIPTNISVVNPIFKIINATTNTFQITYNSVVVDIVTKETIDNTKWHFEKINTSFYEINITGLPNLKRCRINVLQRTGNMVYFRTSPPSWIYAPAQGSSNTFDAASFFGFALYDVFVDVVSKTLRMTGLNMKQNTGTSSYTITALDRASYVYPSTLTEITSISLQFGYSGGIVNGTEIKIFRV